MMNKGFTLVETLIAVTILTIAVAGPFYAASRALIATQLAGQRLTASYLAQEGVDYIHAMRGGTFLYGAINNLPTTSSCGSPSLSERAFCYFQRESSFSSSIATCRGTGDGSTACMLDVSKLMGTGGSTNALQVCSGACSKLNLVNGAYTLDSGTASPFTRTIQLFDAGSYNTEVVVTVSWSSHGQQAVVVRDYLSPWQ